MSGGERFYTVVRPEDFNPAQFYVDPLTQKITYYGAGAGATLQPIGFNIPGVASFAAQHGRIYTPTYCLVDVDGEECETDVEHSPGVLVLTFAQPFTGKLTIF